MPANPIGVLLRNRRAGHHTLVWARPDMQAPETFTVSSPAFDHDAPIPERYKGRLLGTNRSPALAWSAPPDRAVELLLVVQDPDVPIGPAAIHALAAGIDPSLGGIAEQGLANPSPVAGLVHGKGFLGHRGWAGPRPPRSHGPHSYVFQLYAVDRRLELQEGFSLAQALRGAGGHVLARTRLDGTYEIR